MPWDEVNRLATIYDSINGTTPQRQEATQMQLDYGPTLADQMGYGRPPQQPALSYTNSANPEYMSALQEAANTRDEMTGWPSKYFDMLQRSKQIQPGRWSLANQGLGEVADTYATNMRAKEDRLGYHPAPVSSWWNRHPPG